MVKYWIWPVTPENWEIVKRDNVWATHKEYPTRKVKRGDEITFYLKGAKEFCGIYKVISDWYENNELRWADELRKKRKIYRYEIEMQRIVIGSVKVEEIKDQLAFMRGYKNLYVTLRGTGGGLANFSNPISREDYNVILERLRSTSKEERKITPFPKEYRSRLESLRRTVNVKEHILGKLREMEPSEFQNFIAHLLEIIGFEVKEKRMTRDGGVDIEGKLITDIVPIRLKVQVKRWKDKVGADVVRNLRGALDMTTGEGGVIITTSDFTRDALEEAKRSGTREISLVNGERLVKLILKYFDKIDEKYKTFLGIRRKTLHEQFEVI